MDKMPKPSLFLIALIGGLAAISLHAMRSELVGLAQEAEQVVPVFPLQETVAAGTTVRIDGSSSMAVLNRTLADQFKQRYAGTEVTLAETGEGAALQALQAGSIDLAALGRSLTDQEEAQALTEVPITREKIAIIIGRDNPFQGDLTFGDFAKIFRGEITNWAEIGGPNVPLRFIDRPAESDVRRALSEYEVFKLQPFEAGATAVPVAEDSTAAVVRELGNDGISYAIASEVLNQEAVRVVSMHSTLPDDPRYPYSQPRNYVYRGEPGIPVAAFLGFATNAEGQAAVVTAQKTESANVTAGAAKLPNGVTLSPDGEFMVRGKEDGGLEWLDAQGQPTGTTVADAHRGVVSAVVISPDGQTVISSAADGTIRRWDKAGAPQGDPLTGSDGPILALALSPDGQTLVSGNADGTVQRWSTKDSTAIGTPIAAHSTPVQAIHYPAGGQNIFTGSSDGSLALWNPDGTPAGRIEAAHQGGITHITSSPDGQVLTTAGGDGTVRLWDRATLQPRGETIAAHGDSVSAVAYSPDGSTVTTAGADSTLQLWGVDGVARRPEPITLDSAASSLGYTPAGQLVVGTSDGQVELRDSRGELVSASGQPPSPSPQMESWLRNLQNLPKNTWWILAAIPALLILLGLLSALLGGRRKAKDEELILDATPTSELDMATPTSELDINFSALGQTPPPPTPEALPPEAFLVPVEGGALDGPSPSKLEQARADLAEGKRLMQEERYEQSLICFNSAIEATEVERLKAEIAKAPLGGINAIATQAQAQRGHALARMGEVSEAMESYNAALSLDSSTVEAWVGKGQLLTGMGRYDEALFCFDSALELDGALAAAWTGKGQTLMQMGRQAEGQVCLNRAAALAGHGAAPVPDLSPAPMPYSQTDEGDYGYTADAPSQISPPLSVVVPEPAPPSEPSPVGAYDPDVPFELQQMVMGLPSADTDLTHVWVLDEDDVPPELAAEVAQLPSQPDNALDYGQPGLGDYGPGAIEYDQPVLSGYEQPAVSEYSPATIESNAAAAEYGQPAVTEYGFGISEYSAATAEYDQAGFADYSSGVAEYGQPGSVEYDSPIAEYNPGAIEYGQPVSDSAFAPPDFSATEFPSAWEDEFIDQINLTAAPEANFDPLAGVAGEVDPESLPLDGSLVEVSVEPGDFIPPPPSDGASDFTATSQELSHLPPEILAALTSIPPGSPDSFNLPAMPEAVPPVPVPVAPTPMSWVRLSIDSESRSRFYAVWHVDSRDRSPGPNGETLAVRLYDVTGLSTQAPLPAPIEEQRCHDDFAQDWYLPIPQWERIYLAEIGYISSLGEWRALARSAEVAAIEEQRLRAEE